MRKKSDKAPQKSDAPSKIAGILRAIAGKPHPKHFTSVVICAAGSSTRMGDGNSKQFIELEGIPVVARTLQAYEAVDCVHEIIVVAKEDEISLYDNMKEAYGITKLTKVVKGGSTRQESARLGSDEVDKRCKYIAVADAARCLITPEEISRVIHAAYQWNAASAGIKATDTVKVCDKSAFIDYTPERKLVWMAQTPQAFQIDLYRAAAYVCRDEKFEATDDNQMAEHIRVPVKMVECSRENIKITEASDLIFAKAVLAVRKEAAAEAAKKASRVWEDRA
ncbi:MAG: 2-C-methyl-D-erythritol 4-phosphate cytidylyltransferase [Ruminococcaceae bacterium]|nr:2-C-methyl-D-erythritol 4-phosphate cytidylyltransferase [Oscillospiraceae bacterium]